MTASFSSVGCVGRQHISDTMANYEELVVQDSRDPSTGGTESLHLHSRRIIRSTGEILENYEEIKVEGDNYIYMMSSSSHNHNLILYTYICCQK